MYFEHCYCPEIEDFGVILLIERFWAGWVQKHHVSMMQTLLNSEDVTSGRITEDVTLGRITFVENFYWGVRGGVCSRGTIKLH